MTLKSKLTLFTKKGSGRAYLDYAAGTPLGKAASKVLLRSLKEGVDGAFGNPASTHSEGLKAANILETSRKELAGMLGVMADEVLFTGNATEANNLAILGTIRKVLQRAKEQGEHKEVHIITSTIEHSSILLVCKNLEGEGVSVTYLNPTSEGLITKEAVVGALRPSTALITLAYVNSELGVINPIRDITRGVDTYKKTKSEGERNYPYVHVDASQAMNELRLNPHDLGVDLLTLDSGKCYGPKGVGALIARRGRELGAIMQGGSHERGLRPGTPAVNLVEAFVASYKEAIAMREKEVARLLKLETYLIGSISSQFKNASLNGAGAKRITGFCNFCFMGLDAEFAVMQLDVRGVAVSSASACVSLGGTGSSYVIKALKERLACAPYSLRISMGRYTKKEDVTHLLKALRELVPQ